MLHDRMFVLQTDHKSNLEIFRQKKFVLVHSENRLQRCVMMLLEYDFTIEHLPSKEMENADNLSRLILKCRDLLEDTVIASIKPEEKIKYTLWNKIKSSLITKVDIKSEPQKDDSIKKNQRISEEW